MKTTYNDALNKIRKAFPDDDDFNKLKYHLDKIVFVKQQAYDMINNRSFQADDALYHAMYMDKIEYIGLYFGNGIAEILKFMWDIDSTVTKRALIETKVRKDMIAEISKTINVLLERLEKDDDRIYMLEKFKEYLLQDLTKQFGNK